MKRLTLLCLIICWITIPVYPFGHPLLPLFSLDPSYININHGSYGSAPKSVHEKLREYQLTAELNPDRWFRLDVQNAMDKVRKRLSDYVNCDSDDLVILENASAGINSILKSLKFQSNETILYYNVAYGMVKLTLQYVSTEIFTQEQIVQIELDHETIQNTNLLLKKTQDTINKLKNVKLIVFDHISSIPAILFDIETMIKYFRQQGILTLIDGAHAVGAIQLDLKKLDPDFYLSNTHKWLYNHRSACLLYVKKDFQKLIHPIITSFGYLQSFQNEFFWLGTKDYSSYLTISDALDFRETIANETDIFNYNHQLAIQAGNLLAQLWNSSTLTSNDIFISTMNNIELPLNIDSLDKMNILYQKLINQYNIFLPMFQFDNKFYCRISAQIYMELTDYQTVGKIVLDAISNSNFSSILKQSKDYFHSI
ncbi:unnamed protein product [Rotaria magnacalcarata]|uniref:Aminotransferase class V domain-containing protein n=2 Tax=Rotaria magnacalcarata TaxID=392030 RepID=A0A816JY07_9BILA|nr:unnamed protein product [Rotaria magnacalcarata]CAF1683933.1 unnamed protein product [Rotaria magnacalcarata]CAF1913060.1 unnamed protein product [Rotaria magnacalcarata]CAF2168198.1 unnamed protein product [Rotaria magnacalcarata]CAF3793213.1 unnamed protein product [Rotaria magnacalcarata]